MADHLARARAWSIAIGIAVVVAAVSPPLHNAAEHSLAAHMVQHVLLLAAAPPLLIAGGLARRVAGVGSFTWPQAGIAIVVTALLAHTAVMVAWHVPALYDAAHRDTAVHAVEHLVFLAAGVAFWAALASARIGAAAGLVVFIACLPGTALGVAMCLATTPWYDPYPDLGSQQLAGVAMWAGAGTVYLVAAAVLTVRALSPVDAEVVIR